jgi:hypothetical protein
MAPRQMALPHILGTNSTCSVNSISHIALGWSSGDFFEGIRAAGPQDLSGIKRLYQSLTLDLGLMLNSLSDDDFASPFLRIFVIEREGQVRATIGR